MRGIVLRDHMRGTWADVRWRKDVTAQGCTTCAGYCGQCGSHDDTLERLSRFEEATVKPRYYYYDDETVQRERTAHIRSTNRILSSRGKRAPLLTRLYRAIKALWRTR